MTLDSQGNLPSTHMEKRLADFEKEVSYFFDVMSASLSFSTFDLAATIIGFKRGLERIQLS
ncbi:MAG: hypothetical protein M3247_03540 [Thermoproteota archaeon]|nr:hypothetical protein [Thermoproteota archaeon]